jgi:starvation-inducible DNA-binding protein
MEKVANAVHLPPLDNPHEREALGTVLQATLRDLVDLSLIGKQLHWTVIGPAARSVRLFLDELVGEWRELLDLVDVVRALEKQQWLLRTQLGEQV